MENGRLTAEQVRDIFLENFEKAHETSYDLWEPATFNWQAIVDELNATFGNGMLTAEQVRKAIFNGSSYTSYDGARYHASGINIQAIVDELNETLGGRECENVSDEPQYFQCSECRSRGTIRKAFNNGTRFSFCPDCGAKVRKAVKQ